ncbi:2488_t:CDS:2 [Funneliformis caledonium]|uniref:2488_t:CDS:1 n=1 Tax=Funneliformis caledonium TaxID=1117310 RepID=A0A9N9I655_9GLOM|nr:2488_t:CDS:2 [Funneliformis caledonium]
MYKSFCGLGIPFALDRIEVPSIVEIKKRSALLEELENTIKEKASDASDMAKKVVNKQK